MRQTILAILALAAAGANPAHAQHGSVRRPARAPSGIVLNLHAVAMPGFSIGGPAFDTPVGIGMGPGFGAQIGYALSPRYLIYAGADLGRLGAAREDPTNHWGFSMLELGGRMSFPRPASRITPYVTASVGTRTVKANWVDLGDVKMHGLAVGGGGGITYVISPTVAINAAALVSLGKFGNYQDPEGRDQLDINSTTSARLQFGLDWRP